MAACCCWRETTPQAPGFPESWQPGLACPGMRERIAGPGSHWLRCAWHRPHPNGCAIDVYSGFLDRQDGFQLCAFSMSEDQLATIDALLAIIDTGSFGGAARMLGLTQSTISRRIAQLEGRLG